MAEESNNQEPSTAPEVGKASSAKTVVTPAAVKNAPKPIPVEDNSTSPKSEKESAEFTGPREASAETVQTKAPVDTKSDSETPPPKVDFTPPKKPRDKKKLIVILVIILAIAAVGYFIWKGMSKTKGNNTSSNSSSQQTSSAPSNSYTPVSVAYAYKGDNASPFTLYTRPVAGGDRTAANQKLDASESIRNWDAKGLSVVFATDKAIYTSSDGGKTYKSIVTFSSSQGVPSAILSTDGQRVVYSFFDLQSAPTVISVALDGSDKQTLFTSEKLAAYLVGYNAQSNKIVYSEGCYNCGDGYFTSVLLRDLKTHKVTTLAKSDSGSQIYTKAVNSDLSQLVYATAVLGNSVSTGVANYPTAPYSVKTVDISSGKSTDVASFGTAGEKNANGTDRTREVHVGFIAGTNDPFYTDDGQLTVVKSGKASILIDTPKPILYIPFVGKDTVVLGTGDQTADYTLSSYNSSTKKLSKIFSGDNNTVIFGVTTK